MAPHTAAAIPATSDCEGEFLTQNIEFDCRQNCRCNLARCARLHQAQRDAGMRVPLAHESITSSGRA